MKDITRDDLKAKLAAGDHFHVVDIRAADAFADWHIPGSINVPVIEAMRADDPEPLLAHASDLPRDASLLFVCNEGISSRKAARYLETMGFEVASLMGGMRSWSLVHSEADILLTAHPEATAVQIRRNGKGCLSYLLASNGLATIVDPSVDEMAYVELARTRGLRIERVLETHVHADHVSRARRLCAETGAELCMPRNDRVNFSHVAIDDGEELMVGGMPVKAIGTPGHTGESTCYLVADEILLSGDTLFIDSVGRPDLEKGDAGAKAGAEALYRSLHERLMALPEDIRVFPAHTRAGIPFDGVAIGARLGDVKAAVELLRIDKAGFVRAVIDGIGAKPPSFRTIVGINEGKSELGERDPAEIEAGPNRCAVG